LSAPLETVGEWNGSPQSAAARVILRVREVALAKLRLLSDRQPEKVRVEDHTAGPPAIWLHQGAPTTAWIIVDIGSRAWCQLAYQFGHELGHVFCNSWQRQAKPLLPTQWLEESLAEAFSLRALALLADSWERNPPFPGDSAYAKDIRQYREDMIQKYKEDPVPEIGAPTWFRTYRSALERGEMKWGGPAILGLLEYFERNRDCVEDLGAVNRWPERSGVPIERYVTLWNGSCTEIGAANQLPGRVRDLFELAS